MTAPAAWEPANDVERAMLDALREDDRQGFFQLVAAADLLLPQLAGDPADHQRFVTSRVAGITFLPVFTSPAALIARAGSFVNAYVMTNYAELRRKWPDDSWRLAINPGTPIDAYLTVEDVMRAAIGELEVPDMAELMAVAHEEVVVDESLRELRRAASYPDEDPAAALQAAGEAGDAYGFLDRLLDSVVIVPTGRQVEAEAILEDDFPWRPLPDRTIPVYTSHDEFARSHPDPVPFVEVTLTFAVVNWPDGFGLVIDPDNEQSIELPADMVPWLVTLETDKPDPEPGG
jgi:hypothetical protein